VGKPEGKRSLGRSLHRWEDNSKMDLKKCNGGMDWTDRAQDRDKWRALVNGVYKPPGCIKYEKFPYKLLAFPEDLCCMKLVISLEMQYLC
jgi:hypothetical protein